MPQNDAIAYHKVTTRTPHNEPDPEPEPEPEPEPDPVNADALTNEQLVEVPNLTAFTAHYLASKSDFKDVYFTLRDVAKKMTLNVKKYVYAMNAFYTAIDNIVIVKRSVLYDIANEAQQDAIYTHPEYGMDSVTKMTHWIDAIAAYIDERMDDPIITKLKEVHNLSEEQILTIIDEDAFMNALYRAEQNNIALRYECRK